MDEYNVVDETTAEDGAPFRVVLELDQDSADLNPRDNDDFLTGVIVALDTPDRMSWRPREDADDQANSATIVDAIQDHAFPVISRWLRIFHGATVVLPLYEGTDGLSTGEADDTAGPDEYRGVTFDTPATRKAIGQASPDEMARMLTSDVDTWSEWARGEVYGWVIQRGEIDEDGETVWDESGDDSCWGFIGEWHARESARVALDDFIRAYDRENPGNDEDDELQLTELAAVSTL